MRSPRNWQVRRSCALPGSAKTSSLETVNRNPKHEPNFSISDQIMSFCCCPPTRVDPLKEGSVGVGKYEALNEATEVYVSGNKKCKTVMVLFHDIFGLRTGRHVALADYYASKGFLSILPDFFGGDTPPTDPAEFSPFLVAQPIEKAQAVLDQVYAKYGLNQPGVKVCMIGFCMGSWVVFHESKRQALGANFVAGVHCHPSVNIEEAHGREIRPLVASIQTPFMLVPTIGDSEYVQKGTFVESDPGYDVQVFVTGDPLQDHGFMIGGDVANNAEMKAAIESVLAESLKFVYSKLAIEMAPVTSSKAQVEGEFKLF